MKPSTSPESKSCRAALLLVALTCACTAEITGKSAGANPADPSSPGASGSSASGGTATGGGAVDSGPLPTDRDGVATACAEKAGVLDTGRTPLRRLTRAELDNSVRSLLGVEAAAATSVTPDERMGPFYSNAIAPVDELAVEQYQELSARVATAAQPRMQAIAGCDLATDTACPARFVETFGRKAYRRPLEASEKTELLAVYDLGKATGDAGNGFRSVVEAMLQSPSFLYHDDTHLSAGSANQHPSAKPLPLDPYALASRLSFFLVGSTPDDVLLDAAAQNKLGSSSELAQQAQRLLATEQASDTIGLFHRQWLGVLDLPNVDRDATKFPAFSPELVAAAFDETKAFTSYVLRQGDGKLSTLLNSNLGFPQGPLFGIYGATEPPGYQPGTPVQLDASRRAGLLTQAAFLMRHAHADQTSPVHRGILVRENLLCGKILPPPANLVVTIPPVSAATTTRERFAQHVASPVCAACHKDIDPLGLGFENYDAVGQYRTTDGMGAVDASGAFTNVRPDLAGTFVGAVEMAKALAESTEVADCVSRQWFRFALGRVESFDDACTVSGIQTEFDASDGNVPQLLAGIIASDAFRHVRSTGGNQ
jgi:Protein of unknown function (DUF1588)/Protein of unknown function (DUF1592)/Protein of unknown function (DUF1595)/Protein of unknown function (DUF1585)/Protein of unknown function (DUF1587)